MPEAGEVIAFVTTMELNRAAVFYEGVIGLRLIAREPMALVFDANGLREAMRRMTELISLVLD